MRFDVGTSIVIYTPLCQMTSQYHVKKAMLFRKLVTFITANLRMVVLVLKLNYIWR